jgi:hypothetical protein
MPKLPVGRARALAEYRRTRPRDCRVWLAGVYMGLPWLESAIETGTWAAARRLSTILASNQTRQIEKKRHAKASP